MNIVTLISWDFKRNNESFQRAIINGYDYWSRILDDHGVEKYVILLTCNRVELYYRGDPFDVQEKGYNIISDDMAINHLFHVAAGLDSMSIGENEVLKQVKQAYEKSSSMGKSDKFLSLIFQRAISVGKLVRSKTGIGKGKVSIPSIVYDIVRKNGGNKILLVGNGMLASEIAPYFSYPQYKVTVAGRNIDHVRAFAEKYEYEYVLINDIDSLIKNNDVIITATSSKTPIVEERSLMPGKLFIDLGNPPNIERGNNVITLDEIYEISKKNEMLREEKINQAEILIENEMKATMNKIKDLMIDDIFSQFYRFASVVQTMEIQKFRKMHPEVNENDLEALAHSIINKILNVPVTTLKAVSRSQGNSDFNRLFESFSSNFNDIVSAALQSYEGLRDTQSLRDRTRQLLQKS